jgi:transposase
VEQVKEKDDPDTKALACYGVLLRWRLPGGDETEKALLRFVDGRHISAITTQFLEWSCEKIAELGARVLILIWDNASWHVSQVVRTWVHEHNRHVKKSVQGVRILLCYLPVKSPWLNPIEPKWVHGKRKVLEPDRTLSAQELADRVCAVFSCIHEPHLTLPETENDP